jgi:hypothetical protein
LTLEPQSEGNVEMKKIASAVLALGLLAGTVAEANAVVCARGVYRAGCAGPHGAVVTHRPVYGAAVVRPGVRCRIDRYGRRVCV